VSLRVPVNLASEPFERLRPMVVASTALGIVLLAALGGLVALSQIESGQAAQARQTIARLEKQQTKLAGEQAQLEGVLRQPSNAEVLDRSQFLNSLIYGKAISWTRLFDDLEKVMPYNVRLIQVRPQATGQNQILLDMVVGAESAEPVIQMLTRLESSPQFGATLVHNRWPPSQTEPLLRYRLSVSYEQKL
jgi:Tfp pilus assembly protein PilN